MAAVVCGLSLSVASCKDDDDDPSEEQQRQEQQVVDDRDAAWEVLSQLTDPTTAGDDWTKQTFVPTIGEASEDNPLVRVVFTNTLENAAQRFANLVGLETMDSTTATHTYENPQLGTLVYQRSNDGVSLARVAVNIKCMPQLQEIVFRNPNQSDNNGMFGPKFEGRAYYRFGDVVKKHVKGVDEFWLCVRPSFGPEDKGDSHWVTFSTLRQENKTEKTVNGKTFTMPKGLGTDKENMENLGELLSCILDHNAYAQYMQAKQAKYIFHDFSLDREDLHNYNFWSIVAEGWENKGVARDVFGPDVDKNDDLKAIIKNNQLNLIYGDPSWSLFGYKCTLKMAKLANFGEALKPRYSTATCDMTKVDRFDAHKFDRDPDQRQFFGNDEPHWFIRHATGKELGDGKYDVKKSLHDVCSNVEDRFVYYKYLEETRGEEMDLSLNPECTNDLEAEYPNGLPENTRPYYIHGDVLVDDQGNRWICMAPADARRGYEYSYFISFDKCITKKGKADFAQLPRLKVAQLMAMTIEFFGSKAGYWMPALNNNSTKYTTENMEEFADFNFDEYFCRRDSIIVTERPDVIHPNVMLRFVTQYEPGFVNVMYKGDDGKPYILRVITTRRPDENERLETMYFEFQTHYPSDQTRLMSPTDTYSQTLVDQYATTDPWPLCKWLMSDRHREHTEEADEFYHRFDDFAFGDADNTGVQDLRQAYFYLKPSSGYRKKAAKNDDTQWLMTGMDNMDMTTATKGINMWREPVMTFAVRRVKDVGKRSFQFEDGTKIVYSFLNKFEESHRTGMNFNNFTFFQLGTSHDWSDNIYVDGVKTGRNFDLQEPIQ